MALINKVFSRQILDSRGNPTLEVELELNNGIFSHAAVPSGASTGEHEAVELRDNSNIYMGKSVFQAIKNIKNIIAPEIIGMDILDLQAIDNKMLNLDGTNNKSNLGANAILGVSLAALHAASKSNSQYLFQYINKKNKYILPTPMMNILNGGSHADNNLDFQEFMIVPIGAHSFKHAIQLGTEVFHCLKNVLKKLNLNTNVGDEGGFAPSLTSNNEAITLILQAIEEAGYIPGIDISIALDVAASEFYNKNNNKYILHSTKEDLSSSDLISYYLELHKKYPIISIEDGLDENDWDGWTELTARLGNKMQIVGDDLTVTNPQRLHKAIKHKSINAILIKLNQIGTVTETLQTIDIAKSNNIASIISHRSGETEDTTIADFAVGTNAGQIKTGSLCRSDRVAKYNQLLRIEERINPNSTYAGNKFFV